MAGTDLDLGLWVNESILRGQLNFMKEGVPICSPPNDNDNCSRRPGL